MTKQVDYVQGLDEIAVVAGLQRPRATPIMCGRQCEVMGDDGGAQPALLVFTQFALLSQRAAKKTSLCVMSQ